MAIQISTAIHDGFYTVVSVDKHYTFRLHTQAQDAQFAPGKQIIGYLRGSNNEADYTSFAFVVNGKLAIWKRFAGGRYAAIEAAHFLVEDRSCQQEAGKYYAQTSGNCYICNRLLTTPESIAAGIGPTCASRM